MAQPVKEFLVILCLAEPFNELFHGLNRVHIAQDLAKQPHAVEIAFRDQELFFSGSRAGDINGREDTSVRESPVEVDLHITRALKFFKNNLIHTATGFNQRSGNNGKATTLFDISRSTKKAFWPLKRSGFDTA